MARKEIIFREATAADAKGLQECVRQLAAETDFIVMDESGFEQPLPVLEEILTDFQCSSQHLCLLACLDEEIIGLVSVQSSHQYAIAHIGSVFIGIKQVYWGYGIGSLLLDNMLDWARTSSFLHRLELTVQVRNTAAIHLYQKMGFAIEGQKRHGARTKEGEWLELYYMGQLLDEE